MRSTSPVSLFLSLLVLAALPAGASGTAPNPSIDGPAPGIPPVATGILRTIATDGDRSKVGPYHWALWETRSGESTRILEERYTDPSGALIAVGRNELQGEQVREYLIDQKQIGQRGRITVAGDRVHFQWDENGKSRTATEKLTGNFVTPVTLALYAQKHWSEILAGKSVQVRFAVLPRVETVGFFLQRLEAAKDAAAGSPVEVRMRASSPLIALFAPSFRFVFSADSKDVLKYEGISVPKFRKGDSWKDLELHAVYRKN